MIRAIQTYSSSYLRRHRNTHAKHAVFGTHQHHYLRGHIQELVRVLTGAGKVTPNLLDYGCGKGVFLDEMRKLGIFGQAAGYDPAVSRFSNRPDRVFDLVTCLDVLDQVEDEFVPAAIEDVAQFTGSLALFSIITKQSPKFVHLQPRSAAVWDLLIGQQMKVLSNEVRTASAWEIANEGACPERVIIVAAPLASGQLAGGQGE